MSPALRVRLTALYGGLFAVFVAVLLAVSYGLMARHLHRTLDGLQAAAALAQLRLQYLYALAGATLVSTALGWALAGRELASTAAAFEARERFVANASHELRSPLTVIRTEAEVTLADPRADVYELRAMGRQVLGAADEMDELLEGLMVLAQGSRALHHEAVDLAAAARAAAGGVRGRGVRISLHLDPVAVRGERRLIERLAANLIENGVRYNAPGGFVAVRTHGDAAAAVLDVVNSGPHVDPVVAQQLAEPFERGGRARDGRGAGLGLSIVRTVAEAHGGRLALTPRPEGGLAVRVVLPAC